MDFKHVSVLLNETIDALNIKNNGIYVDCTLGGGGHSYKICEKIFPEGRLIGIDQDDDALTAAGERLNKFNSITTYVHSNFSDISSVLENLDIPKVDGILMDLGVSSYQLDEADRGFSYQNEARLDMRMDRTRSFSAYEVVNKYSEKDLARIIKLYGEEKWSSRIAKFIVENREDSPIETTADLVEIIKKAVPAKARREGPHPAKRTFQAIRIEVNSELDILERAIEDAVDKLNVGGRLCIITFHSLEDRIVKETFKRIANPCTCPVTIPVCVCGKTPKLKIISRKPIIPGEEELNVNPRARSAKLRIAEKIMSM